MEDMGMTDGQFKSWIRLVLKDISRIKEKTSDEMTKEELEELLKTLQMTLED